MPTSLEPAEKLIPPLENAVRLATAELGELKLASQNAGLRALHARLERRRWVLARFRTVVAVAAVAAVAFAMGALAINDPASVSYSVDGKAADVERGIDAVQAAKTLRFSDGSEVRVQRGALARVRATSPSGAELALEQGKIDLNIVRGAGRDWSVSAGPFVIHVTGTSFTTEWSPEQGSLQVWLQHGSVTVKGPLTEEAIVLRAGQRLSIRLPQREVLIRDIAAPAEPESAAAQPSSTSWAAPSASAKTASVHADNSAPVVPQSSPVAKLDWAAELAAGNSAAVVRDAEQRGVDHVLSTSGSLELAHLADAARFERQSTLARRALLAQRERFGSSSRARDAAFLLGRLEEAAGQSAQAVTWYARYEAEAPQGTYVSEALGRRMLALKQLKNLKASRAAASEYLSKFPTGAYSQAARSIAEAD